MMDALGLSARFLACVCMCVHVYWLHVLSVCVRVSVFVFVCAHLYIHRLAHTASVRACVCACGHACVRACGRVMHVCTCANALDNCNTSSMIVISSLLCFLSPLSFNLPFHAHNYSCHTYVSYSIQNSWLLQLIWSLLSPVQKKEKHDVQHSDKDDKGNMQQTHVKYNSVHA